MDKETKESLKSRLAELENQVPQDETTQKLIEELKKKLFE